jgi:hypothetical protein
MFMLEQARKFFQLPSHERLLLVQAWMLLLVVDLALRLFPLKHLLPNPKHVIQKGEVKPTGAMDLSVARQAWLVEIAGRYAPITATCLKQALVLSWLLGRQGIATTLQIGIARREGVLTAHAWLERNGQVVFGQPERDRFAPLVPAR